MKNSKLIERLTALSREVSGDNDFLEELDDPTTAIGRTTFSDVVHRSKMIPIIKKYNVHDVRSKIMEYARMRMKLSDPMAWLKYQLSLRAEFRNRTGKKVNDANI